MGLEHYGVEQAIFAQRGNGHLARAAAAWLSRRLTAATLRDLAKPLGLTRPDSVGNLTRRMQRAIDEQASVKREIAKIEAKLVRKTASKN